LFDPPRVDHDDALQSCVPLVLEKLGKDQSACPFHDIWKKLPSESLLLCPPTVGEVEENRIESVEVGIGRVPDDIEVSRLFLGRDEASVDPDPRTSGIGEQCQCFS
jgi:hypothetical protein